MEDWGDPMDVGGGKSPRGKIGHKWGEKPVGHHGPPIHLNLLCLTYSVSPPETPFLAEDELNRPAASLASQKPVKKMPSVSQNTAASNKQKNAWFSIPSKARARKTYLQNNETANRKFFVAL